MAYIIGLLLIGFWVGILCSCVSVSTPYDQKINDELQEAFLRDRSIK